MNYNITYNTDKDEYYIDYSDDFGYYHHIESFSSYEEAREFIRRVLDVADWK